MKQSFVPPKKKVYRKIIYILILFTYSQLMLGCAEKFVLPDPNPPILEKQHSTPKYKANHEDSVFSKPQKIDDTKPFRTEKKKRVKSGKPEVRTINTNHCHNFSDNDSIKKAREDALAIVQQKAVSLSQTMILSEYELDNGIMTKDKIRSISAASIQKTDIIEQKEFLDQRRICLNIRAKLVLPSKEEVLKEWMKPTAKVSKYPKNDEVIIKSAKVQYGQLHITAFCMKRSLYNSLIISWYDDGDFSESTKEIVQCPFSHKTIKIKSNLPDLTSSKMNYDLMLLD